MSAMDRFRALLGGGQSNLAEAPESVLGEWQRYSTESAPPTQSDRLMGQMEAGGERSCVVPWQRCWLNT